MPAYDFTEKELHNRYLGIFPGETSITEVIVILDELGASISPGTPFSMGKGLVKYS